MKLTYLHNYYSDPHVEHYQHPQNLCSPFIWVVFFLNNHHNPLIP